MKYVRYNLKRNKGDNFIFSVIIILVLIFAFFIGTFLSKILFTNNKLLNINVKQTANSSISNANTNKSNTFITVQCGVFSNKSNADAMVKTMTAYGYPGIFHDDGSSSNKVMLGVYNQADADNIIKTLNGKGISISTKTFIVTQKDLCNEEIAEMVSGLLQMTGKFSSKQVSAIQTKDYKTWTNTLKVTDKNSTNEELCLELKTYIKNLTSEITKDKISACNIYLDKELREYK